MSEPDISASEVELDRREKRIRELEAELERCKKDRDHWYNHPESECVYKNELERLREALRYYADEYAYRWSSGPPIKRGVIQAEDRGHRARAALRPPEREEVCRVLRQELPEDNG